MATSDLGSLKRLESLHIVMTILSGSQAAVTFPYDWLRPILISVPNLANFTITYELLIPKHLTSSLSPDPYIATCRELGTFLTEVLRVYCPRLKTLSLYVDEHWAGSKKGTRWEHKTGASLGGPIPVSDLQELVGNGVEVTARGWVTTR